MTQQTSPFVETKFGWDFGESNWNTGMDENLLKFSYLHDSNINAIVASLPAPVNGEAYFRTTDRRVHFVVNGSFVSTPIPIWHELTIKSTGKKYTYNGTALTPSKTLSTINVADYGAVGDGVTESLPAFNAAISYAKSIGGGRIVVPSGKYMLSNTLELRPILNGGPKWFNIVLEGDGASATTLDFTNSPANADGIGIFGWGGRLEINQLCVLNAKGVGINVNKDIVAGSSTSWISRISFKELVVQGSVSDGIRMTQTYMGKFENIESRNNGGFGFDLRGFHTSLVFSRCWAGGDRGGSSALPTGGNGMAGWRVNGITYSEFQGCASDLNNGPGYVFQNCAGVVVTACGSESNAKEGFLVRTRTLDTTGIPADVQNIRGLRFVGCAAVSNGTEDKALYSNLIGVSTADSRPVTNLSISECVDIDTPGTQKSMAFNANSGNISVKLHNNNLSQSTFKSGNVVLQDSSVVGLSAVVRLIVGSPASISNITESPLPLFEMVSNNMNATFTNGGITIPKGVNRIKITVGVDWAENLTGFRAVRVFKTSTATSPSFVGTAASKTPAADSFVFQNVSTAIIDVNEGDFFGVAVTQNSGSSLQVRSSPLTFMSVEVMG